MEITVEEITKIWKKILDENKHVYFQHPTLELYTYAIPIAQVKELERLIHGPTNIKKLCNIWHVITVTPPYEAIYILKIKTSGNIEYWTYYGFFSKKAQEEYNKNSEETSKFNVTEKMLPVHQKKQENSVAKKEEKHETKSTKLPTKS